MTRMGSELYMKAISAASRFTRRRRMYPQPCRVLHAASQPAHIAPRHLLYEASRKCLQPQLHGATRVPAQVQQQQQQQDYKANLKQRQIAAREWIAPWLSFKAKSESVDILAAVRTNAPDFSPKQQDSALIRLLAQSWQVAAANPVAVYSDEEDDDLDLGLQSHDLESSR